jgi:hypothetical protein
MRNTNSLLLLRKAEESQPLFRWPDRSSTETDRMPSCLCRDSEQVAGKSKKRDGFLKPKSEPLPKRTSESAIFGSSVSWMSCLCGQPFPECGFRCRKLIGMGVVLSALFLVRRN